MGELRLEIADYEGPTRWRWLLTSPHGDLLASHQVALNSGSWQFAAFRALPDYLRLHVPPDRRAAEETRLAAEIGDWAGSEVFGPVADAMTAQRPATVRVIVPDTARQLMFWPMQVAHASGTPIALHDVTLVMHPAVSDHPDRDQVQVGNRLRILGLFSLPTGRKPLNLRQERMSLVRLFSGIAASGSPVDARMLQYGVTRKRLAEVLSEPEGWDIIHISGHGAPGELILETNEGSPDPVAGTELAVLLSLARPRVKLVTVSACWSAAAVHRMDIGLSVSAGSEREEGFDPAVPRTLVTELVALGCAVLAMRFPVADRFAIAFGEKLYRAFVGDGASLPQAVGIAIGELITPQSTAAFPALSACTPALFGSRAVDLSLGVLPAPLSDSSDIRADKMAGFPPQPERLVGRTAVMTAASAVLAPGSGIPGVLLYGMPGGGKTACALELAYTHEHVFDTLIWFKTLDEVQVAGALTKFALTLGKKIPGLRIADLLDSTVGLAECLPALARVLQERRVMIIADNVDPLFDDDGQWRDTRWGTVIDAICANAGGSRIVLTCRQKPAAVADRLRPEAVDALSLDEALLLARDLPNMGRLIRGSLPGVGGPAARRLAREVLDVTQGHPRLLEFAEGQAADPGKLAELIEAGRQAWRGTTDKRDGIVSSSKPNAALDHELRVLDAWTRYTSDRMHRDARDLFWLLCCIEERDRTRFVIDGAWSPLWALLRRPGEAPDPDGLLEVICAAGLISAQHPPQESWKSCAIHVGVVATGRSQAGKEFRAAVDTVMATFWEAGFRYGRASQDKEEIGTLLIAAGVCAVPYLLRLGQPLRAFELLNAVLYRDRTGDTAQNMLPVLEEVVTALTGTEHELAAMGLRADAAGVINPHALEQELQTLRAAALARHDYKTASWLGSRLAREYQRSGRFDMAFQLDLDNAVGYARSAQTRPWSTRLDEARRMFLLAKTGQAGKALGEIERFLAQVEALPDLDEGAERTPSWIVRETLLVAGYESAIALQRWEMALRYNAEVISSMLTRSSPEHQIARFRLASTYPLRRLGRLDEALEALSGCHDIFESEKDFEMLGKTFAMLAGIEGDLGHYGPAIELRRNAIRYNYAAGSIDDLYADHHNMAADLARYSDDQASAGAHFLVMALMCLISGHQAADAARHAVANHFFRCGGLEEMTKIWQLKRYVASSAGVNINVLLRRLGVDTTQAQQVLDQLITEMPAMTEIHSSLAPFFVMWEPVIAALLAADQGNTEASEALDLHLTEVAAHDPQWAALTDVVRRIRAGERTDEIVDGLRAVDKIIAQRALGALIGRTPGIQAGLWPALALDMTMTGVVFATLGENAGVQIIRKSLKTMPPFFAPMADAIEQILRGERGAKLSRELTDPFQRLVIETILIYCAATR